MMVALILTGSLFSVFVYADDLRANRLRQHGLPVPTDRDLGQLPLSGFAERGPRARGQHEPAGGLGQGAGQRRVDREGVGELVHGQAAARPRSRRQDQLAGAGARPPPRRSPSRCGGRRTASRSRPEALHLRPRVGGQRQHDRSGPAPRRTRSSPASTPTVAISGSVKTVAATCVEPQRQDRLAERVPHRDPALHRRDRGEHQHAGAVAGRVDARHGGAGHPVDLR